MALVFLKLRKIRAQIAAMRKSVFLCQQKETFQIWQRAEEQAIHCASVRDKEASAGLEAICARRLINRSSVEQEYANFFWRTEQLKELQKTALERAEAHSEALEATSQARMEHIRCENKADQAIHFYKKVFLCHLQQLLRVESEENEEIANNRHVLKSSKANFYEREDFF